MARVMICDDDCAMAETLAAALVASGHDAETCRHTMDMLRAAADGQFDLIAFGLDMAGFGRAGALEALSEIAPHTALIALHDRPSEIVRPAAHARLAAILSRPVATDVFVRTVTRALNNQRVAPAVEASSGEHLRQQF